MKGEEKMEKLDGTSMNLVQENIKKLKEIFPEIFIEGKIDFDLLRQICNGGGRYKIPKVLRKDTL